MAYLGKFYTHDRDENFSEFLEAIGVPADKIEPLLTFKATQKLEKDGSDFILTSTDPRGEKVLKFQNGVEFDETVNEKYVAKTTFTVNGDVVDQVQKYADGRSLTLKREYSPSELVVTLNASSWDGTARRYYKA